MAELFQQQQKSEEEMLEILLEQERKAERNFQDFTSTVLKEIETFFKKHETDFRNTCVQQEDIYK